MNALDKVWSALSDASNALGDADAEYADMPLDAATAYAAIDAAIDHATRLVIARIERDERDVSE
jgi:hypothetical protein